MATIKTTGEMDSGLDVKLLLTTLIAYRRGDFTKRMPNDWTGLHGKIADTLNEIIDMAERTTGDFARVSQVVGKAGKVNARLSVADLHGSWAGLVDSSNTLIEDLVSPLSEVMRVIDAVSTGDLSQSVPMEIDGKKLEGQFLKSAEMVNGMVNRLGTFSQEVTRVAREVGTEGKLGGQAQVPGVSGTWKDLTDSVNGMAANLTSQVRNIADVTTAVAQGDLGKKITVEAKGEILELKNTVNIMVDQLSTFAAEVTRVAREVGTEGKLGGLAEVAGVSGTWRDLTESVNGMASNLTTQVRNIADVTTAVANGDLGKKITAEAKGEILQLKDTINTMVDQLSTFAAEVTRVAREVGTEGKLGGQATMAGVGGTWKDLTDSVNGMASNLTAQVRNIADVTTAVATAKAMVGDREKCLEAGASDYISKPVNVEQLIVGLEGVASVSALQERVLCDPACMQRFLDQATVSVTAMFRDPGFYRAFRQVAVPLLKQRRSLRIWDAGCASGEEVYSLAILLHEEGLLDRARLYATDVNQASLDTAREGIYPLEKMKEYTENYQAAGGKAAFSEYYQAGHGHAAMRADLSKNITWAQHNLVSDASFNEFDLILCRNVLIYFNRRLQERVHRLLYDSLAIDGLLALGRQESLQLTPHESCYQALDSREKIYQRVR